MGPLCFFNLWAVGHVILGHPWLCSPSFFLSKNFAFLVDERIKMLNIQLIIYTAAEAEYWSNKIQQTNTMSGVEIKIHIRIVLIKKILGHPLK